MLVDAADTVDAHPALAQETNRVTRRSGNVPTNHTGKGVTRFPLGNVKSANPHRVSLRHG
jgi:hypothetical protein